MGDRRDRTYRPGEIAVLYAPPGSIASRSGVASVLFFRSDDFATSCVFDDLKLSVPTPQPFLALSRLTMIYTLDVRAVTLGLSDSNERQEFIRSRTGFYRLLARF